VKDYTVLEVNNVPDETDLENAERMLRSFFRTIEPEGKREKWDDRDKISWELYAEKDKIGFYAVVPRRIERLIRSRIFDAYPSAEIKSTEFDPAKQFTDKAFVAQMSLHKHFMFATKSSKAGDAPISSILNSMSGLEEDQRMLLQISMVPINNKWQGKAYKAYRKMLFQGVKPKRGTNNTWVRGTVIGAKALMVLLGGVLYMMTLGNVNVFDKSLESQKNTPIERAELKGTQQKIALPAFNVAIRIAAEAKDKNVASTRLTELANSFIEMDADNEWRRTRVNIRSCYNQMLDRSVPKHTNDIVTTSELSPLVRLVNKHIVIPELKHSLKTYPLPQGLEDGTFFAKHVHNGEEKEFYYPTDHVSDFVHPLIITGAMGAGKTTLINNLMISRAVAGYGVIIIDTQGDQSRDFIKMLPQSEMHRLVWLNFGDVLNPPPIDLMEFNEVAATANPVFAKFYKQNAKNEMIALFKKLWGQNFGPQTEYITRHNITAQMETGGTFLEMFRMLTDKEFRESIIPDLRSKAPLSWKFWKTIEENYEEKQLLKMFMPSINKLGALIEDPMLMNITSQGRQTYNFRQMMDEAKIVVITIPKGILVENWNLIARLMLSKIWLAALSREEIHNINDRLPCFLAADEADDLINENFPTMLSQSRKFRLGIVMGFQYLKQIKQNHPKTYSAMMGNMPHIVAMKIGTEDQEEYGRIFAPHYAKQELIMPSLHGIARLSVRGNTPHPFTIKTEFDHYERREDNIEEAAAYSREHYTRTYEEVDAIVQSKIVSLLDTFQLMQEVADEYEQEEADMSLLDQLRDEEDVA